MTELETHLLNALEQLQQDYMQRLSEWESAFVGIAEDVSLTQRDNAMLNERVMQLSQQVQHLSEQTERLSQLYSENWR
ncbi:MobD [Escherichia coli]|uniref:MbeD family mobilization/exclusion protein n=1 Tax=Escherichia coli TaxID=562 RepID=UPI000E05B435|nr:MbeD family mobilization/exclusion protein [Escherichia coli]STI05292.1 MobD [Escherichia coli]